MKTPKTLTQAQARRIWLHAQRLDEPEPFGSGPAATAAAVAHLGYVQIDTINVIERAHHHILFTRIPAYARRHLVHAQSIEKSVFEYWTHALAYIPTADFRFFVPDMKRHRAGPDRWHTRISDEEYRRVLRQVRDEGPMTVRDMEDEVLLDKEHPWMSRKPSKFALQRGFYDGKLAISRREGMLKTYDLTERHFGWDRLPQPATERQVLSYMLDRALRSQGLVSLRSIHHTHARFRKGLAALVASRVRQKTLVPVSIDTARDLHWTEPATLDQPVRSTELVHVLSPFDPLVIQRDRTLAFFGYGHAFEAYVTKEKRRFGYFALPVLAGDEIVAAIDLKTDRGAGRMLIQAWHWVGKGDESFRAAIEEALHRFQGFQLA